MTSKWKKWLGCLLGCCFSLHAQVCDPSIEARIMPLIRHLTSYGILHSQEDWAQLLTLPCNGKDVSRLLIELARSFRELSTLKGAITTLNIRQMIKGSDEVHYWLENAVGGGTCQIKEIETLLKRMVASLPVPLSPPSSFHEAPIEPIEPVHLSGKLFTERRRGQVAGISQSVGYIQPICASIPPYMHEGPKPLHYDIIIAGAGCGGCGAAIQAARMGCSVLLLEETDWIGGQMTSAGVSTMDEGCMRVQERGIYRELCSHLFSYYQSLGINPVYPYGRYCAEPRILLKILLQLLGDAAGPLEERLQDKRTLDLLLYTHVTRVLKEGDCVIGVEITTNQNGTYQTQTLLSKIVIDATEWGDLLPLAAARYRVGNCTSDELVMHARTQALTWTATLKEYPEGVPLELQIKKPLASYAKACAGFRRQLYLGEAEEFGKTAPWSWQRFIGYRALPNSLFTQKNRAVTRTQLNFNNDVPTTVADIEDVNHRYFTCKKALSKTLNVLYYIQHELQKKEWSVANDQGYDTPYQRAQIDALIAACPIFKPYRHILYHFSIIPYVRESRRMIGLHTLTAREIERQPGRPIQFPHTVALGDYFIDLHGTKAPQYLDLDLDQIEDVPQICGERGLGPFAIPFECFIPERIDGFLPAEKNFSQSRMVNGATRLQPHTLLMGQAVGAIAALAVKQGVQPRNLNPLCVQQALLDAGCTLSIQAPKSLWSTPGWKQENLRALYPNHVIEETP